LGEKQAIQTIKASVHNGVKSNELASDAYNANMAIQDRFYGDKPLEDDIDTSLSNNANIGAVILPEDE
jgi:hypothetical protein